MCRCRRRVGAQGMEVRLHVYNQFVGTVYFDDLMWRSWTCPRIAGGRGF